MRYVHYLHCTATICESVWKTTRFHSQYRCKSSFSIAFFSICVVATVAVISMGDKKFKSAIKLVWGSLYSPPHKFFPDPQNLQDWRTANFFQMSPLLYDGINERYCFLLRVLLPLILFPLVSIRLTKQWHFVAAKSEQNYSDCEQRRGVWGIVIMMITSWFGKEGYIREGCSNLHLQIKLCLFPLKRKTMLIFCAALNCISKTGRFVILSSLQPN